MYDQNEPMYENNTSIYNYMFPDNFLWELALFLVLTGVALHLVSRGLSKMLGVRRRAFLNDPPVNPLHHKVDWTFRILGAIVLTVTYFIEPYKLGSIYMVFAVIALGFFSELFRAVIEKKYAENPNEYKYTIIHFPIMLFIVFLISYTIFPELTIELVSTLINRPEDIA